MHAREALGKIISTEKVGRVSDFRRLCKEYGLHPWGQESRNVKQQNSNNNYNYYNYNNSAGLKRHFKT